MNKFLKNLLVSSIVITITYFGFMYNIVFLQTLIGILYGIMIILLPIALIFLFGDFSEAEKYKAQIKDEYTKYSLVISLIVIPATCWILYVSQSYSFLACYILLVIMSIISRIKVKTLIKNR